jgi:medium-chain acyl-[acyl-carrier-protein] hydrolase
MSAWIVRKPRPRAKVRLFCFPYAGGGASIYRAWPDALPHLDVCAIQPPGRETRMREPPFTRLDPLVDAAVEAILPLLDQPFAFFGYSLGAYVAFEAARRLRARGAPAPVRLFLAACSAPQTPRRRPPIHALPEPELIQEIRSYAGTPAAVLEHEELMTLLLPLLRADFGVFETYSSPAQPPLDVPLSILGGLTDEDAPRADLDAWREHTTRAFVLRMFPGNHFFINTERTRLLTSVLQDLGPLLAG